MPTARWATARFPNTRGLSCKPWAAYKVTAPRATGEHGIHGTPPQTKNKKKRVHSPPYSKDETKMPGQVVAPKRLWCKTRCGLCWSVGDLTLGPKQARGFPLALQRETPPKRPVFLWCPAKSPKKGYHEKKDRAKWKLPTDIFPFGPAKLLKRQQRPTGKPSAAKTRGKHQNKGRQNKKDEDKTRQTKQNQTKHQAKKNKANKK